MKNILILCVLAIAQIGLCRSRYTGTVTIPAGGTNASEIVELFSPGKVCDTIDTVFFVNSGGPGTGTVSIAQLEYGVETNIMTQTNMQPGVCVSTLPRRVETVGSTSVVGPYIARLIKVDVVLKDNVPVSKPTMFSWVIYSGK